jgi:predicted RNase H-like nuclease (RuvC/YqgF family)
MEEKVIEERVGITEVNYRRLYKACLALCGNEEENVGERLDVEFSAYEQLLEKFQLEINMNQREINHYEAEKTAHEEQMQELMGQTDDLKVKVQEASKIRKQKEECNELVQEMTRTKRVTTNDEEGNEIQIVAQLNSSREEDEELISTLEAEIEELRQVKAQYLGQWQERKQGFEEMMQAVEAYRNSVLGANEEPRPIEQDEEMMLEDPATATTGATPAGPAADLAEDNVTQTAAAGEDEMDTTT